MLSKSTIAKIIQYLGGPISAAAGWAASWLFIKIPDLHIFASQDGVAKAITTVIVFAVTAILTWIAHTRVLDQIMKDIELENPHSQLNYELELLKKSHE